MRSAQFHLAAAVPIVACCSSITEICTVPSGVAVVYQQCKAAHVFLHPSVLSGVCSVGAVQGAKARLDFVYCLTQECVYAFPPPQWRVRVVLQLGH